ncbi:hypothetical protein [Methylocystis parvus]|uniref:hypothetical protein n=1 Tax=Methylocystis parvus TaxID=134 RepID=UPI003C71FF3C
MGVVKKVLFAFVGVLLLTILIASLSRERVGCTHPIIVARVENSLRALPFVTEMFGSEIKAREITTLNEMGNRSWCQCSIGSSSQGAFTLPVRYLVTRSDEEKTVRVEVTQIGR